MAGFLQLGNDLYTGKRSFDFVGRRKLWVLIAVIAMLASIAAPFVRGGLELGIEFTGGSEFTVSGSANPDQAIGSQLAAQYSETPARVSVLGDGSVRVQTDALDESHNAQLRQELANAYGVDVTNVAVSTIGPSWGADITRQMLIGLGVFVVLASLLMALYFRTWKMALAAFLALAHDLVVTFGIYAATGVEITPAAVIGFLTILGYSLYDTVVVFDKMRENVAEHAPDGSRTFGELVNLAINQTLVRSINTSVVALLPVAAILFIGAFVMGAGTLRDISLALFIGILVGALSTIFLAGPLYAWLRMGEGRVRRTDARVRQRRGEDVVVPAGDDNDDEKRSSRDRSAAVVAGDPDAVRTSRASGEDDEDPWELEGADDVDAEDVDAEEAEDVDVVDDTEDDADDAEDAEADASIDEVDVEEPVEAAAASRGTATPAPRRGVSASSRPAARKRGKRRR